MSHSEKNGTVSNQEDEKEILRARWLAALRSGKYQQARGWLRDGDAMCCLGVLCDVVDASRWEVIDGGWCWRSADDTWHGKYPPRALLERVGVTQGELANRNDGLCGFKRHSFAEIADFIEKCCRE